GLGMRLRRLMGVADQIVASRFSSIDLSNKALWNLSQSKSESINSCEALRSRIVSLMFVRGELYSYCRKKGWFFN
ncbi:hypothetical protein ACXHPE_15425, partial [Vibrio cincinnatiensis]